ncbi:MAG TPA: peptide-methionine (S)-S-oxide reductase MsrA [Candidatus Nanopelagicaceae bacterium]|nr:peptide-methionine (S)-S-oxide reductase MsrA [Candidatus Nanopelagicaceae bacterium]
MADEIVYFATGCFWGAERRFWQLPGVNSTRVGYLGGARANPSYEQVCSGATGHAESVEVGFDPARISFKELLTQFWTMHDPTTLNRQGNDIGSQYRSAIFTTTPEQFERAQASADLYQRALTAEGCGQITTEIRPTEDNASSIFWPAEEYHQRYLEKNPLGYDCHSTTGVAFPSEVSA